jgi:hypothetical protein
MRFSELCVGAALVLFAAPVRPQTPPAAPLPDPRQLMRDVTAHQKALDQVRENYTYTSTQTTQDMDAAGKVTKTETVENDCFFVNGHAIERTVKKNGKPLDDHEQQKETGRVTKQVEKAEKTPRDQPLEGPTISVGRVLELMNVGVPRRKDAKTHGIAEDASKKVKGTIWVDEADREMAHLEAIFVDNFHIAGGLVVNLQKGSSFRFDQAPVNGGLWLPTAAEGNIQARVLLFKNARQHFAERDSDYKVFSVDTQQNKDAKVVGQKR